MADLTGIGSLLGSIIRARPQSNPDFLNQVNAGLTPSVNPYLAPTSQLKRVFGNNADELNMAFAGTTGRGILESRDAMQKMQEANRLAKLRDEAQAELQSQAAYDDYTLDAARNKENQRFTLQRDDAQYGTPEFRGKQRQLKFDVEELALNDAKAESPERKKLRELVLKDAERKAREAEELEAFELKNPALKQRSLLNRVDPFMRLGTGDSMVRPGTGEAFYGPVPVETPGPLDQYGRRGKSTRRFMQPSSIGPNPAVYSPGSLLKQNNGDKLDTGGVEDLKPFLRAPVGSGLQAPVAPESLLMPTQRVNAAQAQAKRAWTQTPQAAAEDAEYEKMINSVLNQGMMRTGSRFR